MKLDYYNQMLGAGEFSDVYLEESQALSLKWEEEKIEAITKSEESGVGLRFLTGEETRFGFVDMPQPLDGPNELAREKLVKLRDQLSSGFSFHAPKEPRGLILCNHSVIRHPANVPLSEKIDLLKRAYKASQTGPHIRQVTINYGEKIKRIGYVNSEGDCFVEKRVYQVFSVTVTVERNKDMQTAYESLGGISGFELFDGDRIEKIAEMVGIRAHQKLDAPQAPVGEMPVVIASSAGGTLIHEAIGHSLEADAVFEGTSPAYVGRLGQTVANEKLTVYDNPTVPFARGSFHYDDEGVKSEATKLIENGVLKNYLFDRMSAKKAGRASNGHGRRESYAHRPIPRMSNTYVAPGPDDPAEILASFQNGFLVTKMGGGQVNTTNGDFVFEVEEGFHVENGKKRLVRGATLLGNGPETLKRIDKIGSDHGWAIGTCGKEGQGVPVGDALPTVHIQKLVVGGQ